MIDPKQIEAFDALVQWARDNESWGLLTALVEDGPDNVTDFAKLLKDFTARKDGRQDTTDVL